MTSSWFFLSTLNALRVQLGEVSEMRRVSYTAQSWSWLNTLSFIRISWRELRTIRHSAPSWEYLAICSIRSIKLLYQCYVIMLHLCSSYMFRLVQGHLQGGWRLCHGGSLSSQWFTVTDHWVFTDSPWRITEYSLIHRGGSPSIHWFTVADHWVFTDSP